jgi:hypothetical protein
MNQFKLHIRLLSILLIIPLFSIGQTLKNVQEIKLDTTTTEGRPGIAITLDKLPGQRFVLEIPEIYTLRGHKGGLLGYKTQDWKFSNKGADMEYKDNEFNYSIQLRFVESKNSMGIKWNIALKNLSDTTLHDLAAFNCWSMNWAPLFKDLDMDRTFVKDNSGKKIPLKQVHRHQGEDVRTMQFYPAAGGVPDLSKDLWINQWNVISNQKLTGNEISVISSDSKWLFENKVDGKVAYFFNNWEHDHGCVHAAPLLASSLAPGKTAKAAGEFVFKKVEK